MNCTCDLCLMARRRWVEDCQIEEEPERRIASHFRDRDPLLEDDGSERNKVGEGRNEPF